jgi:hypothetical protein
VANFRQDTHAGKGAKLNLVAEIAFMNERPPESFKYRPVFVVFLAETSDGQLIHFARFRLVHSVLIDRSLTLPAQRSWEQGMSFISLPI